MRTAALVLGTWFAASVLAAALYATIRTRQRGHRR